MHIGIIGAGMAGLACAERLAESGHKVLLFDKGRGAGGRMSVRRTETPMGEAAFDHGAQYFTVRDPGFQARAEAWIRAGLIAPWPAAGEDAFVGTPGMNAPLREMAGRFEVHWGARVMQLAPDGAGWRVVLENGASQAVAAVVVALPAEQAAELTASVSPDFSALAEATPTDPCWTVMAAFSERLETGIDCWRGDEASPLVWAARNSSKPGRTGPEAWVLQASPAWSRTHLEASAEEVIPALLGALFDSLAISPAHPIAQSAHRWRYARSGTQGSGALWDPRRCLGLCGDWLLGPRVEAAWLSGTRLADLVGN
ncbi:MAG: NAD/FAD-dependent oxidoreductase [Alphaproteobacteria bacterium PA2]|nr:MAG: NAD/FAD-dependent oxidoreductase [Alphaproteobacteria bacterium PA2]